MAQKRFDEVIATYAPRLKAVVGYIVENLPEHVPAIMQVLEGAEAAAIDEEAVMADDARANALAGVMSDLTATLQAAMPSGETVGDPE